MPFALKRNDDARVVRRVLRGQRDAFAVLVERYLGVVRATVAARLGNRHDAEDVVQETFLRAFRALDTLREPAKFGSWLLSIARNTCTRFGQKRGRESESIEQLRRLVPASALPPEDDEMSEILHRQILKLDEDKREVLLMHYFAGKSLKEMGELLGLTRAAVAKRLQRARDALGERMLSQLKAGRSPYHAQAKDVAKIMGVVAAAAISWNVAAEPMGIGAGSAVAGVVKGILMKKAIVSVVAAVAVVAGILTYVERREQGPKSQPAQAGASQEPVVVASVSDGRVSEEGTTRGPSALPAVADSEFVSSQEKHVRGGHGTITGTVVDGSGTRIAGAQVEVECVDWDVHSKVPARTLRGSTTTTQDGAFAFEGLPFEYHVVMAKLDGAAGLNSTSLSSHSPAAQLEVVIRPCASVAGRVVDRAGAPVAGAMVYPHSFDGLPEALERAPKETTAARQMTDAEGRFAFDYLWPGQWQFCAQAEGYATAVSDSVSTGATDAEIVLGEGGSVSGRVVVDKDGQPAPGVALLIYSEDLRREGARPVSDANGLFRADHLAPGTFSMMLGDPGYLVKGESPTFEVAESMETENVVLRIDMGGTISGRVYDMATRAGIAGVTVHASGAKLGGGSATTDASGSYCITGIGADLYRVRRGKAQGYSNPHQSRVWSVQGRAGKRVEGIDFRLTKSSLVYGSVVDTDGKPVASAHVTAFSQDTHCNTVSSDDGTFVLDGFAPGATLYAQAKTAEAASERFGPSSVGSATCQDIRLVVSLVRNRSVSGRVVTTSGNGVADAEVILSGPVQASNEPVTDQRGDFKATGLCAGVFRVLVRRPGSSRSTELRQSVTVPKDRDVSGLRLVLEEPDVGTIAGRVVNRSREGIEGAHVSAYNAATAQGATTDKEGHFVIEGLQQGEHRVQASHGDWTSEPIDGVLAGTDGVVITMDENACIEGRVVQAGSGEPVRAFQIVCGNLAFPLSLHTFTDVQDPEGAFRLRPPSGRAFTLLAKARGYAMAQVPVAALNEGEKLTDLLVALEPGCVVEGLVRDRGGNPVAEAAVYVASLPHGHQRGEGALTRTAADGRFVLDSVSPGPTLVWATHPSYTPASAPVTASGGAEAHVEIVLGDGGAIEGIVTLNGRPAPGATVDVSGGIRASTDEAGAYQLTNVPNGETSMRVMLWNQDRTRVDKTRRVDIEVREGAITRADVDFAVGMATVLGVVMQRGVPVEGATVFCSSEAGDGSITRMTHTDAEGAYGFTEVPAGEARLRAEVRTGRLDPFVDTMELLVEEGGAYRQDFELSGGGAIVGVVSGSAGGAFHPVWVLRGEVEVSPLVAESFLASLKGVMVTRRTFGDDGSFVVNDIKPGVYTVVATTFSDSVGPTGRPEYRAAAARVEVTDGAETPVALHLP